MANRGGLSLSIRPQWHGLPHSAEPTPGSDPHVRSVRPGSFRRGALGIGLGWTQGSSTRAFAKVVVARSRRVLLVTAETGDTRGLKLGCGREHTCTHGPHRVFRVRDHQWSHAAMPSARPADTRWSSVVESRATQARATPSGCCGDQPTALGSRVRRERGSINLSGWGELLFSAIVREGLHGRISPPPQVTQHVCDDLARSTAWLVVFWSLFRKSPERPAKCCHSLLAQRSVGLR